MYNMDALLDCMHYIWNRIIIWMPLLDCMHYIWVRMLGHDLRFEEELQYLRHMFVWFISNVYDYKQAHKFYYFI
jgi:hypothetical protein